MKKVITVADLCCERCARRLSDTLELSEGIIKAKAIYKENSVFVEVKQNLPDELLKAAVENAGFEVLSIRVRHGIFG